MTSRIEQERPEVEPKEKIVYFQRTGEQERRAQELAGSRSLFGSDIFYKNGDLFYITWRDIKNGKPFSDEYNIISRLHPQVDIYAPYSHYKRHKEMRIHQINKDDGSIETAIRSMDHILEQELGKEITQAKIIGQRTHELLDLFTSGFSEISQEQFEEERRKTFELLVKVGFNPATVINQEKREMGFRVVKGSFGHDILGRRNQLISIMALQVAYRRVVIRERQIGGHIAGKFIRMREALIFEREFSRAIFVDVAQYLSPEGLTMPNHILFKDPQRRTEKGQVNIIKGMIGTMCFQLRQPRAKTYWTVSREAEKILKEVAGLLLEDRRGEIVERDLFGQVYRMLTAELEKKKEIYPLVEE